MDPHPCNGAFWLHFDDAEVAELRRRGADLCLRFAAASVRREATPARPAAAGHATGIRLTLSGAVHAPLPPALFGRLSGGRLRLGGRWQSRLALPASVLGPVRPELAFANGNVVEADGHGLAGGFEGPSNFRESFAC